MQDYNSSVLVGFLDVAPIGGNEKGISFLLKWFEQAKEKLPTFTTHSLRMSIAILYRLQISTSADPEFFELWQKKVEDSISKFNLGQIESIVKVMDGLGMLKKDSAFTMTLFDTMKTLTLKQKMDYEQARTNYTTSTKTKD